MNVYVLSGSLGKKPELKTSKSDMPYCQLNVAVRGWSGKDKKETTDWFYVTVFGDRATSLCNSLDKGSKVVVRGRLSEKKDSEGKSAFAASLFADEVDIVGWPKDANQDGGGRSNGAREASEEVPF